MENKNPYLLKHMKEQLEQYGKMLQELSDMLGVDLDAPGAQESSEASPEPKKNKAQGEAEVRKHWELTDNDPLD